MDLVPWPQTCTCVCTLTQVTRAMLAELAQLAAAHPGVRIGSMAAAAGVRLPTASALRGSVTAGGAGGGESRPGSARSQGSARSSSVMASRAMGAERGGSRPGSGHGHGVAIRQVQVGL